MTQREAHLENIMKGKTNSPTKWATKSEPTDFAKHSNEFKPLTKPRLFYRSNKPYRRPEPK